jgi:DnaK suppressor protein
MASATRKSLASRAGAAARKVVSRSPAGAKTPGKTPGKTPAESAAKPAAKKTAGKKTTAKAAAKKAPAKKAPAKKAPAKKTPAKKTAAEKAPAKKTSAKKTAPTKKAATKAPVKEAPVKPLATTAAPRETTARKGSSTGRSTGAGPADLVVLEAEDPWTKSELEELRTQLRDDVSRLTGELAEVEGDLAGMIENSGEGAGHDQADVGSASFERDQEMVIVNNARNMLVQSQHALERIADGTYGQCEICGNPIGKNRLMAFPRATLCLSCKQREERR